MLGTAQSFGLLGTKCRRDGAIRPAQASFRGLVDRPEPRRCDRKNAAVSFNPDIARIGGGGRDEGNPRGLSGRRLLTHPFCQRARLSKAPAGEQQPDLPPIARRRELVAPRDRWPRSFQGSIWGLHERNYRPGESRLRPDCFRGLVLPETSGFKRSSTARVQKIQSCHYRAAISHYTNSVWNQEFMPQTGGEVDFLKYSCGESRWHDKGGREPGDVRGAITSSACGSSVCWQRAHRSREPLENSRSTITPCVGTGGTMFRRKPARHTLQAPGRAKISWKRSSRTK